VGKRQAAAEPLFEFDRRAREAFRPWRKHPLVRALGVFGQAGDQPQLRLLCAGVMAAGLARGDGRLALAGVRMLLAHEAATAAKSAVKHSVDRVRPRSDSPAKDDKPRRGGRREKELSSFPSGHSAGALAVALAFGAEYPCHRPAALAVAGAIGAVQVPTGAHYPSDVAAGWTVGALAAGAIGLLWPGRSA